MSLWWCPHASVPMPSVPLSLSLCNDPHETVPMPLSPCRCPRATVPMQSVPVSLSLSNCPRAIVPVPVSPSPSRCHSLRRRDPASPRMTVMGFLGSVQNCSRTGEKASRLLSSCGRGRSAPGSQSRPDNAATPTPSANGEAPGRGPAMPPPARRPIRWGAPGRRPAAGQSARGWPGGSGREPIREGIPWETPARGPISMGIPQETPSCGPIRAEIPWETPSHGPIRMGIPWETPAH